MLNKGIDASKHVWLQLLRKAGWKGEGGLGAQGQGISAPLEAWIQGGRQGIGVVPRQRGVDASGAQPSDADGGKEGSEARPSTSLNTAMLQSRERQAGERQADGRGQKHARRGRPPKREWQTVAVEEPLEKKVKRWRQVLQVSCSVP